MNFASRDICLYLGLASKLSDRRRNSLLTTSFTRYVRSVVLGIPFCRFWTKCYRVFLSCSYSSGRWCKRSLPPLPCPVHPTPLPRRYQTPVPSVSAPDTPAPADLVQPLHFRFASSKVECGRWPCRASAFQRTDALQE